MDKTDFIKSNSHKYNYSEKWNERYTQELDQKLNKITRKKEKFVCLDELEY